MVNSFPQPELPLCLLNFLSDMCIWLQSLVVCVRQLRSPQIDLHLAHLRWGRVRVIVLISWSANIIDKTVVENKI